MKFVDMQIFNVIILIASLVTIFSGCIGNKGYIKTAIREDSIQLLCERRNIPWQWDSMSQVFTFTTRGVPAKIMVGSNLVLIGTERVVLDGVVERKSSTIVVPPDFIAKVFEKADEAASVLSLVPTFTGKYRTIMVDAGHGGKDPGALGESGTVEKDIVFDIAQRLKKGLEQMGFKVLMTRDSDRFISLEERTELASRSDADLFVSIHANSSKSRKTKGLEIYYSRTLHNENDLMQRKSNELLMFEHLDISSDKAVTRKIVADMMYSRKFIESSIFADNLIGRASENLSALNRGSRTSGFFVVKNTLIPAVLFEVGYLSNASEAKLLKTEEYRQKIADVIAESIKDYSHES